MLVRPRPENPVLRKASSPTATIVQLGFDYSPYLQGLVTYSQAVAWYNAGLGRCALALDTADDTLNSARNLNAAGIQLDAYRELLGPSTYVAQVQNALQAFDILSPGGVYFRRFWLTAEDTSVGEQPSILVPALASAVKACDGFDTGIYTASWVWIPYFGNTTQFSSLRLWNAGWDKNPDIEVVQYGGWDEPDAHQYASPVNVAGVDLDLDAWLVASSGIPTSPTPPPGLIIPGDIAQAIDTLSQVADILTAWKATTSSPPDD